MRVAVDQERCCGTGNCVMIAPEVFDQRDSDGVVVLRQPQPPPAHTAQARRAAANCPCAAIKVNED
ncbi:ferredoxin [Actinokineospora sp. UTMC 2448]|uniref:ferredoxin n=1 Tax=Actinokineospora sp. UTMC 2448 TaxID=2268449 RepID=UPI002164476F|nr:ferredoxin [Actinokineospora sp. UTMC 2448]UVS79234.1 Ferredoxin-2 [Actinokineospora sp. UTMC 2448]